MSAATTAPTAGLVEISLRIGQRVRHHDFHGKRVTGVVRGLSVEGESDTLHADVLLDVPLVIPPIAEGDHELRIYRQHVPAHELAPFDEREELIEEMLAALVQCRAVLVTAKAETTDATAREVLDRRIATATAAIAKAAGGAA